MIEWFSYILPHQMWMNPSTMPTMRVLVTIVERICCLGFELQTIMNSKKMGQFGIIEGPDQKLLTTFSSIRFDTSMMILRLWAPALYLSWTWTWTRKHVEFIKYFHCELDDEKYIGEAVVKHWVDRQNNNYSSSHADSNILLQSFLKLYQEFWLLIVNNNHLPKDIPHHSFKTVRWSKKPELFLETRIYSFLSHHQKQG